MRQHVKINIVLSKILASVNNVPKENINFGYSLPLVLKATRTFNSSFCHVYEFVDC